MKVDKACHRIAKHTLDAGQTWSPVLGSWCVPLGWDVASDCEIQIHSRAIRQSDAVNSFLSPSCCELRFVIGGWHLTAGVWVGLERVSSVLSLCQQIKWSVSMWGVIPRMSMGWGSSSWPTDAHLIVGCLPFPTCFLLIQSCLSNSKQVSWGFLIRWFLHSPVIQVSFCPYRFLLELIFLEQNYTPSWYSCIIASLSILNLELCGAL